MGKITIIGLGPGDHRFLTKEALDAIGADRPNFLRTDQHETIHYFIENKIAYKSFDYLYESKDSFHEIYQEIVASLLSEAKKGDLNYLVPGSPLIAEKTVKLLMEALDPKDYTIIQGLSFIEPVLTLAKIDPVEGFILVDGDQFHWTDFNFHVNTLVTQVYNKRIISDLKLALGEVYGDDHQVALITDAGLENERVDWVPVYKLDRLDPNYQSSLLVPKLEGDRKNNQDLAKLMETLRGRHGCPWDLAQTHESITDNLIEEAYEAVEAIQDQDLDHMVEELGDVLFQVYFHSQIALESGEFNFYDITTAVTNKLIYRHPHVFGDLDYDPNRWEKLKYKNQPGETSLGYQVKKIKGLPSLLRGQKVYGKLAKALAFTEDLGSLIDKMHEKLEDLGENLEKESGNLQELLGKLLYTTVILCYHLNISAEQAMNQALDQVIHQVLEMEKLAKEKNLDFQHLDPQDLEGLWTEVKKIEK